jgi:hypothetical protein
MTAVSPGVAVAARVTMSGVAVFEADSKSVLTPVIGFTGCVLELAKLSGTLTGSNEAVGVMAMTKLCRRPPGMLTGVFGVYVPPARSGCPATRPPPADSATTQVPHPPGHGASLFRSRPRWDAQ